MLTAFRALFHLILPTLRDGYYFIAILLSKKLKPRMVSILLTVTDPDRVQPRKSESKSHALNPHKLHSMLLLATCRCWAGSLPFFNHGRSQRELCLWFFSKLIWPHYPITKKVCTSLITLALDKNQDSCSSFTLPLPVAAALSSHKAFSSRSALCLPNR